MTIFTECLIGAGAVAGLVLFTKAGKIIYTKSKLKYKKACNKAQTKEISKEQALSLISKATRDLNDNLYIAAEELETLKEETSNILANLESSKEQMLVQAKEYKEEYLSSKDESDKELAKEALAISKDYDNDIAITKEDLKKVERQIKNLKFEYSKASMNLLKKKSEVQMKSSASGKISFNINTKEIDFLIKDINIKDKVEKIINKPIKSTTTATTKVSISDEEFNSL